MNVFVPLTAGVVELLFQRSLTLLDDDFVQLVVKLVHSDIALFKSSVVPLLLNLGGGPKRFDAGFLTDMPSDKDAALVLLMQNLTGSPAM